jgi:hypothetical protein
MTRAEYEERQLDVLVRKESGELTGAEAMDEALKLYRQFWFQHVPVAGNA